MSPAEQFVALRGRACDVAIPALGFREDPGRGRQYRIRGLASPPAPE
jgi:hypothetical protein